MQIELYEKMQNPMDAVDRFGVAMAKSGFFGVDNENAGKVLAMICMTERKSPIEILRRFDVIGGKLRVKAQAAYADFRAKGGKVKWLATGEDGKKAEAEFTFEGQTIKVAFTIEQAIKGGAIMKPGSNWDKTPGNMLRARCLSNAIAMLCPEIFAGSDDSEQDEAPAPTISMTATVESVVAAAPVKPVQPPIVEAEVVQPSKPAPAPAVPAVPSVEPTPAAATPAPAAPAAELPADVLAKLEAALADNAIPAHKWMLKNGWLKPGESIANITLSRAQSVLNRTAAFLRAVEGAK